MHTHTCVTVFRVLFCRMQKIKTISGQGQIKCALAKLSEVLLKWIFVVFRDSVFIYIFYLPPWSTSGSVTHKFGLSNETHIYCDSIFSLLIYMYLTQEKTPHFWADNCHFCKHFCQNQSDLQKSKRNVCCSKFKSTLPSGFTICEIVLRRTSKYSSTSELGSIFEAAIIQSHVDLVLIVIGKSFGVRNQWLWQRKSPRTID